MPAGGETDAETLERVERLAGVGNFRWDLLAGGVTASPRCQELLCLAPTSVPLQAEAMWLRVYEEDRPVLEEKVRSVLAGAASARARVRITGVDDTMHFLSVGMEVCSWREGKAVAICGTVQEAPDEAAAEARVRRMLCFDALTDLPNRLVFREQVAYALRRAARDRTLVGLLSLDLDNFRRINETIGHAGADRMLKLLAKRIARCVRGEDVLAAGSGVDRVSGFARLGGDEFAILLSRVAQPQDTARVARRILEAVAAPLQIDGATIYPSLSIGIALYPWDGEEADPLIRAADSALGHAKAAGRNRAQFYSRSMNTLAADRLALESGLRRAIDEREFVLHYQPRVDGRTREIVSTEALIRWAHPERGIVAPGAFIEVAESSRLIIPIGEWVLHEACRQNRHWQSIGLPPVPVSVNISAVQFRQPNFASSVRAALEASRLDPTLLELEITETTVMDDVESSSRILGALKELGVRISIDDFGTGFSSLAYLRNFPADVLKIDRSFVGALPGDAKNASIICAIIDLSRRLGLDVVAEGVETEAQSRFLLENGCTEMQGFLYARPMAAAALEARWAQVGSTATV